MLSDACSELRFDAVTDGVTDEILKAFLEALDNYMEPGFDYPEPLMTRLRAFTELLLDTPSDADVFAPRALLLIDYAGQVATYFDSNGWITDGLARSEIQVDAYLEESSPEDAGHRIRKQLDILYQRVDTPEAAAAAQATHWWTMPECVRTAERTRMTAQSQLR